MAEAFLGLGSNLGDREDFLAAAIRQISILPGTHLLATSNAYRTAPWGIEDQPDFLNLCIKIETDLTPVALLSACKEIEAALGRRAAERWGPREIDIDILLVEGAALETPELTLPHPRITQRRFVLDPLAQIAPQLQVAGAPVSALAASLRAGDPAQVCEVDEAATRRLAERLAASA